MIWEARELGLPYPTTNLTFRYKCVHKKRTLLCWMTLSLIPEVLHRNWRHSDSSVWTRTSDSLECVVERLWPVRSDKQWHPVASWDRPAVWALLCTCPMPERRVQHDGRQYSTMADKLISSLKRISDLFAKRPHKLCSEGHDGKVSLRTIVYAVALSFSKLPYSVFKHRPLKCLGNT